MIIRHPKITGVFIILLACAVILVIWNQSSRPDKEAESGGGGSSTRSLRNDEEVVLKRPSGPGRIDSASLLSQIEDAGSFGNRRGTFIRFCENQNYGLSELWEAAVEANFGDPSDNHLMLMMLIDERASLEVASDLMDLLDQQYGAGKKREELLTVISAAILQKEGLSNFNNLLKFCDLRADGNDSDSDFLRLGLVRGLRGSSLSEISSVALENPTLFSLLLNSKRSQGEFSAVLSLGGDPENAKAKVEDGYSLIENLPVSSEIKTRLMVNLAGNVANIQPFFAWNKVTEVLQESENFVESPLVGAIALQMRRSDPERAMELFIGSDWVAPSVVQKEFSSWVTDNSRDAAGWLEENKQTLSAEMRDDFFFSFARFAKSRGESEIASAWLDQIADPGKRKELARKIVRPNEE